MFSLCIRTTDHGLMFKELEFILFFLLTCTRARKISLPGNGPTRLKYILYTSLTWKDSVLYRVFCNLSIWSSAKRSSISRHHKLTVFFLRKEIKIPSPCAENSLLLYSPTVHAREHFTPVNHQEDLNFSCPKHFLLSRWDLKGNTLDWITSVLQIVHCGVRGLLYLLIRAWYGTR
jgi:hypothetical protein